jgi:hypothetical protein
VLEEVTRYGPKCSVRWEDALQHDPPLDRLTPFGEDFCDVRLPLHTAEIDALEREPVESAGPPY